MIKYFSNKNNIYIKPLGWTLLIATVITYYLTIQFFIADIPFGDEYYGALLWLDQFVNHSTASQRFILLFSQANEHRIFTYRIAVLSDYFIFELINFKRLLWTGNATMILVFFLASRLNRVERNNPWYILPIALLLFVPQHEISDWGIVAFGAIVQYAIIIACLILLNKPGRLNFLTAILLAIVATFSFGNGMFVFIAGFLILMLKQQEDLKEWLIWLLVMLGSVILYFTGYNFSQGDAFKFEFIYHPIKTILYFLTFFGTVFKAIYSKSLSLLIVPGTLAILTLGYLVVFKWQKTKNHPVALAVILFVLLSAAAASISRLSFGIVAATAPRYILLQALLFAMLYIILIDVFHSEKKWFFTILLAGSFMLFGARVAQNFILMRMHKTELENIVNNYHIDYEKIMTFGPSPLAIKTILDKAKHTGVYYPPSIKALNKDVSLITPTVVSEINTKFAIDAFSDYPSATQISGWAFLENDNNPDQTIGIMLKSAKNSFVFTTARVEREDVANYFSKGYPRLNKYIGFTLTLDKAGFKIPSGKYQLGLCILQKGGIVGYRLTPHEIDYENKKLILE